jgi:dihydrodipicolinate synthase/N-acetylneuraminate lyase
MTTGTLAPAPFGRVLTAMVTAFHDDGSVDLEGTARVAEHLADHGHDGVVVSGTTGESPTTSTAEDGRILRAVIEAVGDRLTALATYRDLVPVVEAIMTKAPGVMTAKAAMKLLGVLPNRNVRLPLVPADDALVADLRAVLTRAGLLEDTTR